MRSLKEALLNRSKNIDVVSIAAEEYINVNYEIDGELTFENVDGTCVVNCDGNVYIKYRKVEKLTDGFVWGKVKGDFKCILCANLKSLEGSPKEVGGDFSCFRCNNLESLEGAPEKVGRDFNCSDCKNLKSLEGAPDIVEGQFFCLDCPKLTSLKGAPKRVEKIVYDTRLNK